MLKWSLALFLFFTSTLNYAQTFNISKLDSLFNILESKKLGSGSLTISQNGRIYYERAIGNACIDANKIIRATTNTKYRIGSATKMFTAVVIFQLEEQGKISLNDKLSHYLPALPNAYRITIGNLLNHRSGLHDYTEDTNFREWMDSAKTKEQLLNIISAKGPDFEPGATTRYSNSNYLVLGYIIEQVTGMPYRAAVEKRIIRPCKLANTYYGTGIDINKNESSSYKYREGNWKKEKETYLNNHGGAGSLVSTPGDLVKFMQALFHHKLVSKASVMTMKTLDNGYGMGLFPFPHGSRIAFGHNGRIEEFYSSVRYFPDDDLAVAYITNGIIYPRTDIIEGVLKICFNEPYVIPFTKQVNLSPADLKKYTGRYVAPQMQIEVECRADGSKLILETKGTLFQVEPVKDDYFMHAPTGYFFHFFPDKGELQIKETDNVYYLERKSKK